MAKYGPLEDKLVVLIGGSGFVGMAAAEELLRRGARLRIAARHPERAYRLRPLAQLGQMQFARCNVADRGSIEAALQGADAAVYLTATWGSDRRALNAQGAGHAAEIAAAQGADAFVYVSSIGADAESESGFASTKGNEGQAGRMEKIDAWVAPLGARQDHAVDEPPRDDAIEVGKAVLLRRAGENEQIEPKRG